MVHYPADFSDAPAPDEGEYTFEWLGYVGAEEHELFLAGNTFNVNEKRQVFCAETSVKSSGSGLGGAVGLRGSLGLKAIRHNQGVPEEETKAEWDADCRFVSASLNDPFGRGVYLSIKGKEDDPRDLRCVVTAPDNTQFASVRRRGAFGGGLRTDDMFHFPGEFRPKLGDEPWPRGYYRYVWTGDTADLVDDRSEVLTIRFFHVDDNGNITCHREVPSPATNPRPTWTLSTLEAVTESVALHRQKGDQIELALRKLDHVQNISVPTFVVCEVTHPNGLTSEAGRDFGLERAVMPLLLPASVRFDYPFEDLDAPLEDGAYAVEWFATATRRGSPRFVLARDRFDVQSGRLGE